MNDWHHLLLKLLAITYCSGDAPLTSWQDFSKSQSVCLTTRFEEGLRSYSSTIIPEKKLAADTYCLS
jgi:hypothetical protein